MLLHRNMFIQLLFTFDGNPANDRHFTGPDPAGMEAPASRNGNAEG